MKEVKLRVEAAAEGRTLASLVREATGLSHARSKSLILGGLVQVNRRQVTRVDHRVCAGDRIRVTPTETGTRGGRRPLRGDGYRVLLEDDHLVAVEKDPGLLVVPTASSMGTALVDRLLSMYASRGFRRPRLWVVHRIDRFTSGLVLFARTRPASEVLIGQFAARRVLRQYLAICEGIPGQEERRLESVLGERPRSHKVVETSSTKRGRRASCRYKLLRRLDGAALVEVTLETGRRNQIRVQFAGIGHPILGDRTYGNRSPIIQRVALHAARLGFLHPSTGRPVSLHSRLPEDMDKALRRLRSRSS